ncbi:hypothetical protein N7468_002865 [Penicillium chermesinum]|uniref:Uncharacterized protein n=1 Tax=Penicillium chermesinum TaxID=63820 RepID=A0A9W9TYE2_9EURO|nr:uncharacterized protein N7468_002865 [Penicillium chermesinum]KAJ5247882.1 hypothetical protein N7468_002865 [Penicillium chermesinum]KAJ6151643.1 hypothetical protein N7470_007240 [Penicillium chermesinum]
MLPDDLYSKLAEGAESTKAASAMESLSEKTPLKIGDTVYKLDVSKIPYLAAFVKFQRLSRPGDDLDLVHGDIALFDVALKGLESGYRQCFRCLRGNISQYHTLCETYDFLRVDVLRGQSIDTIFADLKACKTDYKFDYQRPRAVKGDKTQARDAAFRLLFLIIRGKFSDEKKDPAKVYNAVLFIVSHSATFKPATRFVV